MVTVGACKNARNSCERTDGLQRLRFSQHGHGVKAESGMVPVKQAARTQMLDEARTCSNQTTLCGVTNKASGAANQHLTPAQTNPHILRRKTMQT